MYETRFGGRHRGRAVSTFFNLLGIIRRPRAGRALIAFLGVCCTSGAAAADALLFGDTHVHTAWSIDAFGLGGNMSTDPSTADRWAMGLPVIHPYTRARIRIGTPLDFISVSDHAEFLGVFYALKQQRAELMQSAVGRQLAERLKSGDRKGVWAQFQTAWFDRDNHTLDSLATAEQRHSLWSDYVAFADRYNVPGRFTSLIAWEWTSMPNQANLHRVVLTDADADTARQFAPFTALDSNRPEDLWAWLSKTEVATGARFVAIPHNSNFSQGRMFAQTDSDGRPINAEYARTRMRWEPVIEMTQVKGDSETHPDLSPNDEFADFETYYFMRSRPIPGNAGDYARGALRRGLEIENREGVNPYKFGMIGSSDMHNGVSSVEEDNFWGKMPADSIPENKADIIPIPEVTGWDFSAAGLAAVWATENTRSAIVDAFRRKEVYATTGTRIRLRFFGGWDYAPDDAQAKDLADVGYGKGVPMGGDLTLAPAGKAPRFLVRAVKDPKGANLDRVQVVKGWADSEGHSHERVFDVVWSGARKPGSDGRLPPVGDTVDRATASYTNNIGSAELTTVWEDPTFDPKRRAFYYVRVLQIPTPRHSLYDAVALRVDPSVTEHPAVIQERAYSSPIWYTP